MFGLKLVNLSAEKNFILQTEFRKATFSFLNFKAKLVRKKNLNLQLDPKIEKQLRV